MLQIIINILSLITDIFIYIFSFIYYFLVYSGLSTLLFPIIGITGFFHLLKFEYNLETKRSINNIDSELSTLLDDEKEKQKELNDIKKSIKEIKIKRHNIINNKLDDLQNTSNNHFGVMTEDLFLLRKSQDLYQNSITLKKILDKKKNLILKH